MGPPAVVVLGIGPQRPIEMPPTEDEGPVEALGPHRLDHPLGMGIRIRCSEGRADDLHPLRAEHRVERAAELRVPVSDEEPTAGPSGSNVRLREPRTGAVRCSPFITRRRVERKRAVRRDAAVVLAGARPATTPELLSAGT